MKAQNLVKIIVFISLLLIPLALAEKINNLEDNLEDVSLITKIVGNKAYVNHTRGIVSQEPYMLSSDDKFATISFEKKSVIESYDICFDFKGKDNLVEIETFEKRGLIFDTNLRDTRRKSGLTCMQSFTNKDSINFDFEAVYHGAGILKYDIYILPSNYNYDLKTAEENDDLIILDPYLIGTLGTTNKLLLYLPFDNNLLTNVGYYTYNNNTNKNYSYVAGPQLIDQIESINDIVFSLKIKAFKKVLGGSENYMVYGNVSYSDGTTEQLSDNVNGLLTEGVWLDIELFPDTTKIVDYINVSVNVLNNPAGINITNISLNEGYNTKNSSYLLKSKTGYNFEINKNLKDIFSSNNGTVVGSVSYDSKGINFNGSQSNYVTFTQKNFSNDWSICFEADKSGTNNAGVLLYQSQTQYIWLRNTSILFDLTAQGLGSQTWSGIDGQTSHDYCFVNNASGISLYYDGVFQSTKFGSSMIFNYTRLGYYGTAGYSFDGSLKYLYDFNRTLSVNEILTLSNKGNFTNNILDETNSALKLTGDDFILLDNSTLPTGNDARSTCIWFNSTASSSLYRSLYSLGNKANNFGNAYVLSFISGKLKFSTWHVSDAYVSDTIPLNTWHHSCLVYNGSVLKSYVDGEYYKSINYGSINTEPISTFVGLWDKTYAPTYAGEFEGELDEFMVYNYALTSSDILALYNGWNNSIYFNVYDAKNPTVLITDNVTINLRNDDVNYSSSLSTTSGTAWINGVPEGILRITADSTNYDSNLYYYTVSGTNEEIIFSIYLTNQTSTDIKDVLLHVIDNAGQELEGATINIFYQDPETGTYITYGNLVTNPNGEALTTLIPDSYFYIFTVTYDGEKCYETSSAFRIFATDDNLYFKCVVGTGYIEKRDAYNEVSTYLNHINTSNVSGYFTYEGNSSATTYFCLNVYENTLNQSLVGQNCSNTTAALLRVKVNSSSFTSDITYKAIATYIPFGYSIKSLAGIDFMTFAKNNKPSFGGIGLYIMFVLMITVAYLAKKDPRFVIIGVAGVYAGFTMFKLIDIPLLPEKLSMGSGIVGLLFAIIISFSISKSTKE